MKPLRIVLNIGSQPEKEHQYLHSYFFSLAVFLLQMWDQAKYGSKSQEIFSLNCIQFVDWLSQSVHPRSTFPWLPAGPASFLGFTMEHLTQHLSFVSNLSEESSSLPLHILYSFRTFKIFRDSKCGKDALILLSFWRRNFTHIEILVTLYW